MEIPTGPHTSAAGMDPSEVFAAMDLTVGDKQVSSNLMYFVSTKEVHLPAVHIESRLTGAQGSYKLHLSSPVLARSVYISFGDNDAELSDNYVDLLPGESRDIRVNSKEAVDQLQRSMNIISLVDAFEPESASNGSLWK
jgi:beta-mannosidase